MQHGNGSLLIFNEGSVSRQICVKLVLWDVTNLVLLAEVTVAVKRTGAIITKL